MDMTAFASKVCAAVKEELGTGYRMDVKEVLKNNGVALHGLTIVAQGETVAPTIYLERFLEAYEHGTPFGDVVRKLLDAYRRSRPVDGMDLKFFRSFEEVKDRICYRLVGRKENGGLLEEVPHLDYLDLAVCFYYAYHGDSIGDGSILIYNSHVEMWGTSTDELYALAERNTPRLRPWMCRTLDEVVQETLETDGPGCGEPDDGVPLLDMPMKVLSNAKMAYGAACILYAGVLEELAEREGCGLYIIPSSVHEVLLLPDKGLIMEPEELRRMIAEVNSTQVEPEEVLSDSLYYYDAAERCVRVV